MKRSHIANISLSNGRNPGRYGALGCEKTRAMQAQVELSGIADQQPRRARVSSYVQLPISRRRGIHGKQCPSIHVVQMLGGVYWRDLAQQVE